jgi:hypothetical protein
LIELETLRNARSTIANLKSEIENPLVSSVWQHSFDTFLIAFGHHHIDVQISFSFICLLSQDMARMRMATLKLATRGRAKSLRRASVCFQFWHNSPMKFAILAL